MKAAVLIKKCQSSLKYPTLSLNFHHSAYALIKVSKQYLEICLFFQPYSKYNLNYFLSLFDMMIS